MTQKHSPGGKSLGRKNGLYERIGRCTGNQMTIRVRVRSGRSKTEAKSGVNGQESGIRNYGYHSENAGTLETINKDELAQRKVNKPTKYTRRGMMVRDR